jgi:hypothetical protein
VVKEMVIVQSPGPLILTPQKMAYPLGRGVNGVYVDETVVAFTSVVTNVELVNT